jgi:hypothetical protein
MPDNPYFAAFKYRAINKSLIDALVKSSLYFANRETLNDPFDCKVDIRATLEALHEEVDSQTQAALDAIRQNDWFFEMFDESYRDFGILSLSAALEEPLMWSHYADEHRGIALRYEFSQSDLDNPKEILGVSPVDYSGNTVSEWLRQNAAAFTSDHENFVMELLKRVLTAKSSAWAYEQEARIIRPREGTYEIPRSSLTHITFGLRVTPEDEALVREIVTNLFEGVQFQRVIRVGKDFGTQVVDA